ncbi:MFS transporter [Vibrio aestuarianus]|uniref:MFS transporter n=1 Tax=Vibrio aestuarianus TaxID=28171 RepID=A0A9X4F4Z6_9VIBR|nr:MULTISPECIES: MFS transporter [Vibrio]MDE1223393.1 MFS transporter [Vibrio aestuarianus]MDE1230137.1 MFS transporter [Vibrio aestuarianus]MDE1234448.1 MFS transporter [Vibrio aestuarianus]MDE1245316.1 MFS transporter [Vibrio aestuarianus]MDE1250924.1 MFS transporter [Vibrio aestuarianus]
MALFDYLCQLYARFLPLRQRLIKLIVKNTIFRFTFFTINSIFARNHLLLFFDFEAKSLDNITANVSSPRISVPVIALSLYAIASGYLMSMIPLMLPHYGLESSLASWLASAFYAGLLLGALVVEPFVNRVGHRIAFVWCLVALMLTIIALPAMHIAEVWLVARFIAGAAVAGVFVVVESWLMHGDEKGRAKRLGIYMAALYGGTALGQLGIGYLGVSGGVPFIAIITLLLIASTVLIYGDSDQPSTQHSSSLSLKQVFKLNHAALLGCAVSGLTLGAIYGLMPIELELRGINHTDLGSLMALVVLGGMAVQPMVPWLSKFMGRTLLMAMFCLLGSAAIAMTLLQSGIMMLAASLFVLGMATFALYPIAINLGCDKLDENYIVSATQVMLFSYSIGSVSGPLIADWFMQRSQGLMGYLLVALLTTCLYMLMASMKTKRQWVAGE